MDEIEFVLHWEKHPGPSGQDLESTYRYLVRNGVIEEIFSSGQGNSTDLYSPAQKGSSLEWFKRQVEEYNQLWSGETRCKFGCLSQSEDDDCTRGVHLAASSPEDAWEGEIQGEPQLSEIDTNLVFTILLILKQEKQGKVSILQNDWKINEPEF